ncbi:GNAT family N-acetyltransferase [Modestobacter sp. VKM Ac-2978]|uniref:GNAT family N-acetyltransferase n=1 Tax=Modestobacter sp. VKM Ac-2978 TaxID=3004132 RepID=UPI0022AB46D3|nr:GNAT family N-acetyltransferase [Modestobacter sp. VKM Ac-2978]MCZ2847236.1 GNAT family N-acetyltransferase [Modestobacter sp. VKM Ac-2978]
MPPSTVVRPATPDEAGFLTELALRSKAYWGYPADFLAACRAHLTVDPADCDGASVRVAECGGQVLGFWRLAPTDDPVRGELTDLFVEPRAIGSGVGRLLVTDAVAHARARGWRTLELDADPRAEAFYRNLGAVRIGLSPSTASPGRSLPRMSLAVPARHHVVCGALVREGRVLLGHRAAGRRWYPDVWDLPGGHVEDGESELAALRRELREEVGVQVAGVDPEPVARLLDEDLQLAVWSVRDWAGEPVNCCPEEHDELRWVAPDELAELSLADARYVDLLGGLCTGEG